MKIGRTEYQVNNCPCGLMPIADHERLSKGRYRTTIHCPSGKCDSHCFWKPTIEISLDYDARNHEAVSRNIFSVATTWNTIVNELLCSMGVVKK